MTVPALYIFFQPLIQALGTICLLGLAAAGVIVILLWIFRMIWRFVVAAGALTLLAFVLTSVWNMV